MTKLPMASQVKIERLMDEGLSSALADIQEKLYEGASGIEVDTLNFTIETKMALVLYLEDLGYYIDESYGTEMIYVSLED